MGRSFNTICDVAFVRNDETAGFEIDQRPFVRATPVSRARDGGVADGRVGAGP